MKNSITKNGKTNHENGIVPARYNFAGKFIPKGIILVFVLLNITLQVNSQITSTPTTFSSGSYIINMGVVPQTVGNGLKPYGLIYQLLLEKCPVNWIIDPAKLKDQKDFTYKGVEYKGGPFIIEAQYRTPAVNALITTWQGKGVVGVTTTEEITVPKFTTLYNIPRWTMDFQNGKIAVNFFTNAEIPASAYGGVSSNWKLPSQLTCCEDIFVMPHADPEWDTHGNLYQWASTLCRGGIWLGCHAGSAFEDMFNPSNPSQQTNFLSRKTVTASGSGPYYENALVLWDNHDDGTPPYSYAYPTDPAMQFMGTMDAALQNGSEQIFIPVSGGGWYDFTHVGVYDPDHPERNGNDVKYRPAALAYGPVLGNDLNGKIMMQASHNISGTAPANVAAQRAFFNFSYLTVAEKAVLPKIANGHGTLSSGLPTSFSITTEPAIPNLNDYTIAWTSSCGGSFSPANAQTVTFTPPVTNTTITNCQISVTITDPCGRKTFDTHYYDIIPCNLSITKTVTPVSCFNGTNGQIAMSITGGTSPYSWSWTRTNPAGGPTTGTGTTISALSAGTYTVNLTDANNCKGSFTALVTQPLELTATTVVSGALCNGGNTGNVNLTVSGGTPAYTYNWAHIATPPEPEDLVNVAANTYNVTVTDSKGCTASATAIVTQPSAVLSVTGVITNVTCYGTNTGAIDITAAGGTATYTYNWGGGITTEDRTNIPSGTYNVIVTDANGCTVTQPFTVTQPNAMTLGIVPVNSTCDTPPYNGSINLTVTGGTSAFIYTWTKTGFTGTFATTEDLTNIEPGTYGVTVTDSKGCTASISGIVISSVKTIPNTPSGIISEN